MAEALGAILKDKINKQQKESYYKNNGAEKKKEWRNKVYALEDEVSRLKQKLIYAEQDATARVNTAREQTQYFKQQLELLSIKD